ncbi:MAG: hypothetical protein JOZ07_07545 [Solirubrobacterales bacterium]|nr:hypothetical protein [Solirubrobacterales bacterium]
MTALGIEPIVPESGESRLAIADVFRIAIHVQRAALEEAGGGMLDWAEREHPDQAEVIRAQILARDARHAQPLAGIPPFTQSWTLTLAAHCARG